MVVSIKRADLGSSLIFSTSVNCYIFIFDYLYDLSSAKFTILDTHEHNHVGILPGNLHPKAG
jgi:hypothetical protein